MNDDFSRIVDFLPQSIRELVKLLGVTATLSIVRERGGIKLCVPGKASEGHWLCSTVGVDAFNKLVEYAGGDEIEIPLCTEALLALKEREMLNKALSGSSQSELAREYGMSERGVRKLLKRAEVIHRDLKQQHTLPF